MQLHQLIRFIRDDCHIVLFDLQGHAIVEVDRKTAIPIDFYEYDIFQMTSTILPASNTSAICIMLQK